MKLLERIGIFKGVIGDMEAILDAPINGAETIQDVYQKIEREFYTKDLTPAEREAKLAEVEQAIANERDNLEQLQEGLSSALTNDAYFKDEISRILYKKAYVTEEELKNYVDSVIRQKLTTCRLEDNGILGLLFNTYWDLAGVFADINIFRASFDDGIDSSEQFAFDCV